MSPNTKLYKKIKIINKKFKFDKMNYVAPSHLKNFILKDPIIDYLEYYNIKNMNDLPKNKKLSKIKNYSNLSTKNIDCFDKFIQLKGNEFETKVMTNYTHLKIGGNVTIENINKTIQALNNREPIIYQGILFCQENKTYGYPDIIIRGDYLNSLFNQNEDIDKYYIIDIKYSTIKLSADKTYILNYDYIPVYKTQILLYTNALNNLLNQNVTKGFILGKKYFYESRKNKYYIDNDLYNKLACINYSSVDNNYNNILSNSIDWVFKLRTDGYQWKLFPKPSINDLYPNMCNRKDGRLHNLKKNIAEKLKELTLIVNVGVKQRENAFKHNIFSYDHPDCTPLILGLNGKKGIIVDHILKINSSKSTKIITPDKIIYNEFNWREITNDTDMEFFLDYETTTDFDKNQYIFMVGVGYYDIKWEFKCFVAKNKEVEGQIGLFNEFWEWINNILTKYNKNKAIFIHWTHAEETSYNKIKNIINIPDKNFLDLYQIFISEPIVIKGAFNYSLKTIARTMYSHKMIKTVWKESKCNNGLDAMYLAHNIYETKKNVTHNDFKDIVVYNEIDCKVLYEILFYLRDNL